MSRRPFSPSSKRRQFLAMLFALVLAVAACGGSSDDEFDDASGTVESAEENTGDTSVEVDDTEEDEIVVEAEDTAMDEDSAMGEDDTMVDGDIDTTVPEEDEANGGSSADSELGSAELAAAFEAATGDRFSLPFMYLTVDQDCDGCAETLSLYYVPSEEKASILTLSIAFIDGVAQADFSAVDPSLRAGDPRRIAEQLSDTDADFSVDPVSGAVTSWTLDGNTVTMRCLQVDTRPLELRTELCENSIIG